MESAVLILAAGSSSRMGQSKQLLPINGKPMLVRAVETALQANQRVTVVIGSQAKEHQKVLSKYPVTLFENTEWQKGMGRSLKTGLSFALKQYPGIEAILILVCDQPRLTPSHLLELITKAEGTGATLVASRYQGTLGVPALFKKQHFPDLLAIPDEAGASRVIRTQPHPEWVDFPGGETDLDTLDEYRRFSQDRDQQ